MTFEQSCSSKTAAEVQFEEWKRSFLPTLDKLKTLQKGFPKTRAAWESRLAPVLHRRHAAAHKGVRHVRLDFLLEGLLGGNGKHGLIPSTGDRIPSDIATIEGAAPTIMSQPDIWRCWNSEPDRILDCVNMVEQWLTEVEMLVKDGGELHLLVREQAAQPSDMKTAVPPSHAPQGIEVET